MRSLTINLVTVALICSTAAPCRAGFIVTVSDQVTPQVGGGHLYEYTLAVDPLSDFQATDFALDVAPGANLSDIMGPAGWSISYSASDPLVYWSAPLDGSLDVLPGSSASFSFTSPYAPGPQTYSSFVINYATFEFDFASGTVAAPTSAAAAQAVPAPGSLVLLATGIPVLAGWARMRRGRNELRGRTSP